MPVSQELLDILVCPETKQPVEPASQDVLDKINGQIQAGSLRNRGGEDCVRALGRTLQLDTSSPLLRRKLRTAE